ncbi:hypothetical protein SUGI_0568610 [Cryptomeria japonica]|nr:hypothetical protein SUGI_0568610 [Cryptomeria japonica]
MKPPVIYGAVSHPKAMTVFWSKMAIYGLLLSGPTLHLRFKLMPRVLTKTDIISTVKKMVLGQILYGPAITAVFFSLNALLQAQRSLFGSMT